MVLDLPDLKKKKGWWKSQRLKCFGTCFFLEASVPHNYISLVNLKKKMEEHAKRELHDLLCTNS